MNQFRQKWLYILIATVALILIVISIILPTAFKNAPDDESASETGEQISSSSNDSQGQLVEYASLTLTNEIPNLNKLASNLPSEEINNMNIQFNSTLEQNGVVDKLSDIQIREGTYKQELTDNNKLIYTTTFIVDIPSIKQSYVVENNYSPYPANISGLYDYTTLVICPDTSQLLYGPFDCTDRLTQEQQ